MTNPVVLLLGRKGINVEKVQSELSTKNAKLLGGTNLDDVKSAFNQHDIDTVIMGAGIDLQDRLVIIEFICNASKSTSIHMKDWNSGPQGMLPFVDRILSRLSTQ